jgi:tetratricopeptide (TPR) repeat protein
VGLILIHLLIVVGVAPIQANEDLSEIRDLAASGRTYEALASLEPLLGAEPDRVEGLMLKGILLTRLGRVDEAKEIFLGLIELSPELPEPYINLAALYAGAGDYDRSVRILKLALETHPSYLTAYENLTKVYGKLASEAYRSALGDQAETDEEPMELVLVDRIYLQASSGAEPATAVEPRAAGTASPAESLAVRLPETAPDQPSGGFEPGEEPVAEVAQTDSGPIEADEVMTAETRTETGVAADTDRGDRVGPDLQQVPEMIDSWALAWTEQRVEEYLGFYSRQFTPMNGLSLEGWEVMRRGRLTGPGFISISYKDLEVEEEGSGKASARFVQLYDSSVLQDSCVKVLSLLWEDGEWKIADERIEE